MPGGGRFRQTLIYGEIWPHHLLEYTCRPALPKLFSFSAMNPGNFPLNPHKAAPPAVPLSNAAVFAMPANLNREWVAITAHNGISADRDIALDFSNTLAIDSAGASFIRILRAKGESTGHRLSIRNIRRPILTAITAVSYPAQSAQAPSPEPFAARVGSHIIAWWTVTLDALSVLTEMLYWGTIGALGKRDIRKGTLGDQMWQLGYKALGIISLLSLLIGIVLGLQAAMQLRLFGAGVYLAPMIGISMIRELGPLLTAIILAGRTGSATTAEIATMSVNEEIDALRTMGINPIQFVVVPKFWAISLTMPVLSLLATLMGIVGGYLVSLLYLDIGTNLFWSQFSQNVFFKDVMAGFIKSVVFSWLIIWVGAFHGLRVRGGAEAVGRETTASVVTGIFIIIITDAVFSFII
jgi:phospholipid/cholesterol/gamma-HCH transport system permease protein